jgi:hypothetical protein
MMTVKMNPIILLAPSSVEPQNFRNGTQQMFRNHPPDGLCTRADSARIAEYGHECYVRDHDDEGEVRPCG